MGMLWGTRRALWGVTRIRWLLRDEFRDARVAGAVNGTPATPGPGTRVVVDTDGDGVVVNVGEARFNNPNSVWGDPGYWLDGIDRIVGSLGIFQHTRGTVSGHTMCGFDSNQAGVLTEYVKFEDGTIYTLVAGADLDIGSYTVDDYTVIVYLRSAGIHIFIQGGSEYPDWTLLYSSTVGAVAIVYPGCSIFQA